MSFFEVMGSIFWFMLLVAWFWLMVVIIADLFRDRELSGWAKAFWCIFVVLIPWLGVLCYLITRGRSMNERAAREARESDQAFRRYVRDASGERPGLADELGKLADLRDRGVITPQDYETAKSRLLTGGSPSVVVTDERPPQPSAASMA